MSSDKQIVNPTSSQPPLPEAITKAAPFLRWAGGKTWLIHRIGKLLPQKFRDYHEPFLGGGAVFFYLNPQNNSYLSDLNDELIDAYVQLQDDYLKVISHLKKFQNTEKAYYELRSKRSDDRSWNAARFVFLNKASYNGVYRVNKLGEFNVPYGHNVNAPIYDADNFAAIHERLKRSTIESVDFGVVSERVGKDDLVFLDPPYTVMHSNNGFIEYNQKLFTWEDQERLARVVQKIKKKKAKFVVTNASHESVRNLYSGIGKILELGRTSTITSKIGKRGATTELIITNCL